jgi:hypothetical protein
MMHSLKSAAIVGLGALAGQSVCADPVILTQPNLQAALPQSEVMRAGLSAQEMVREAMILLSPQSGYEIPRPVFNDIVDFIPTSVQNAADFNAFLEASPSAVTNQLGMVANYWWLAAQQTAAINAAEIAQQAIDVRAETEATLALAGSVSGIGLLQQSPYGLGEDLLPFDLILDHGNVLSQTDALRARLANEMSPGFFAQN